MTVALTRRRWSRWRNREETDRGGGNFEIKVVERQHPAEPLGQVPGLDDELATRQPGIECGFGRSFDGLCCCGRHGQSWFILI